MAGAQFLKLYDTGVVPVVGVGTPVLSIRSNISPKSVFPFYNEGIDFPNGIGYTTVATAADNGTGNTDANTVIDIIYKEV